jgi:ABC-type antimicrobial peptide transport system permease subunit
LSESEVAAARERLKALPELDKVLYGFQPTNSYRRYGYVYTDTANFNRENLISIVAIQADRSYLDLIEVKPIAGELFSENESGNTILINETLADRFGGADQIVGRKISLLRGPVTVKGVISDVCYFDPKSASGPFIYEFQKEGNESGVNQPNTFLFSFKEGVKWNELEEKIQDIMTEIKPDATYHFTNMETDYMEYIKSEYTLGKLLRIITFVCIVIAISGLYSIVALLCQKRRKEIAVHKIHGARMNDILRMFIIEYLPIVILSAIAAFAVGAAVMHRWLSNYVRQTHVTVWVYISVFICMLLVIGLTVFGNIRRAMMENPADVIKSE